LKELPQPCKRQTPLDELTQLMYHLGLLFEFQLRARIFRRTALLAKNYNLFVEANIDESVLFFGQA
jgi:hypothetical protein